MVEFLVKPAFKFAVLPIGSAILGVAVKYSSRNDQYAKLKKEDFAVGLDLTLTACLMFVVLTTDRAVKLLQVNQELASLLNAKSINSIAAASVHNQAQALSNQIALSGWLITFMLLGLVSLSTVVRKWGWQSETEMHPVLGIALPIAFGILAIIGVMVGAIQ